MAFRVHQKMQNEKRDSFNTIRLESLFASEKDKNSNEKCEDSPVDVLKEDKKESSREIEQVNKKKREKSENIVISSDIPLDEADDGKIVTDIENERRNVEENQENDHHTPVIESDTESISSIESSQSQQQSQLYSYMPNNSQTGVQKKENKNYKRRRPKTPEFLHEADNSPDSNLSLQETESTDDILKFNDSDSLVLKYSDSQDPVDSTTAGRNLDRSPRSGIALENSDSDVNETEHKRRRRRTEDPPYKATSQKGIEERRVNKRR